MTEEKPRLRRDLQPVRARVEDRDVILLRDPLALSTQVIALGTATAEILPLIDGTRGVPELRMMAIEARDGDLAAGDEVERLVSILDERKLLENESFREACRVVMQEWRSQTDRPAVFAGAAYPDEPELLGRYVDELIVGAPEPRFEAISDRLVALVVPHVDMRVGWPLYGAAYALLGSSTIDMDRVIVLGTGHAMDEGLFCPTTKHHVLPSGRVETDVDAVVELGRLDGTSSDDFPHRGEHSIEFQLVFLGHLFGADLPPVVPILCGSVDEALEGAARPREVPGAGPFVEALGQMVHGGAGRAFVIASVDLAHVGPKYGDEKTSAELLQDAVKHETALIDALEAGDPAALWSEARRVENRHHVCGLSALGWLLEILPPGTRGRLIGRDVMRDPQTSSSVGFAALAFFAPGD